MIIPCPIAHWKKQCPKAYAFENWDYFSFDQLIQQLSQFLSYFEESILSFAPHKTAHDLAFFFAAWRLGKIVYPLNPKIPFPAIEARLTQTNAKWIDLKDCVLSDRLEIDSLQADRMATFLETSSSSKIACHTLSSHFTSAQYAAKALHVSKQSKYCLNLPLFHVSGIASCLRTFWEGGHVILPEKMERATHISMVPTQLFRLLQKKKNLPDCECLLVGGAPLPQHLLSQALDASLPIYVSYGMTETASIAFVKPPRQKTKILPHLEFRIATDGELLLRGASLFLGYFGKEMRKESDWFPTKDFCRIREDGLEIIGRKDRQFISGGENIQPEEIEKALLEHPSILEARVEPIADEEFGMRPIAKISVLTPLSEESLKQDLRRKLPAFKVPIKISISTESIDLKLAKMIQE